jgi:hypothetical protein
VWRRSGDRKEESSFCEQKEAKKLFETWAEPFNRTAQTDKIFFASFFSKKEDSSLGRVDGIPDLRF